MTPDERLQVTAALRALEAHGRLTPELVVTAAREAASPLHRFFTWSDSEAAQRWRLVEARTLIRVVTFPVVRNESVVTTVRYVRDLDKAPDDQGYISVPELLASSEESRRRLLHHELTMALAQLSRAADLATSLGVEAAATAEALQVVQALLARVELEGLAA